MLKWTWAFLILAAGSGLLAFALPEGIRPVMLGAMVVFAGLTVAFAVQSGKQGAH